MNAVEKRSHSVFGSYTRLPDEIVSDIFSRLPVKSLKRFKCGCKKWSFLFRTQYFISKHLSFSTRNKPCLLLYRGPSDQREEDYGDSNFYSLDKESLVLEPAPYYLCPSFRVIGSCDGILGVTTYSSYDKLPVYLLWNPAIGQTTRLPECTMCLSFFIEDFLEHSCSHLIGFGRDSVSYDYKFVLLHVCFNLSDILMKVFACEVYSCVAQSWTACCTRIFENIQVNSDESAVSLRGRLYWIGNEWDADHKLDHALVILLAFDLNRNAFDKIEMPESLIAWHWKKLCIYRENSLAVFVVRSTDSGIMVDLWVAGDGLVCTGEPRPLWTLLFTVREPRPFSTNLYPVRDFAVLSYPFAMLGDEEIVFNGDRRSTFLFNRKTHNTKKIPGIGDLSRCAVDYVESLVPVSTDVTEENIDFEIQISDLLLIS